MLHIPPTKQQHELQFHHWHSVSLVMLTCKLLFAAAKAIVEVGSHVSVEITWESFRLISTFYFTTFTVRRCSG